MKKLLIAILCLSLIFGLTACSKKETDNASSDNKSSSSSKSSKSSTSSNSSKKAEKVTLSFYAPAPDDATKNYYGDAVKRYEEKNSNVKIELTYLPGSGAEINKKLNAAKLSGMYPDVFVAYLNMIAPRGGKNEFASLDNYMKDWDGVNDVFSSVLDMGVLNDKTIALGFYPLPDVFAYRTDYFEEAGLDPTKPPSNWEELEEYANKLVVRDDAGKVTRAGVDIPVIDPGIVLLEAFMRQNGSPVVDEANSKPAFGNEASIEALAYLGKLREQNLTIAYDSTKTETIPFINGNSAMGFVNLSRLKSMLESKPELKDVVRVAPVLENKEKVAFCAQRFFTIGETSKNKDEAWDFIQFMMSKDEFKQRYQTMGVPVVRKSMSEEFINDNPDLNKNIIEHVEYGVGKPRVTWVFTYNKFMRTAFEEVATGKSDAKTAIDKAYEGLEQELKELN